MSYITTLLVKRFLQGALQEKSIALMIRICFMSIMIGSFSLALVAAIMNGFEETTRQKLQGVNADIFIKSFDKPIAYNKVRSVILEEYKPFIAQITPQLFSHVLVYQEEKKDISSVFVIIGIDPDTEKEVTSLATTIEKNTNAESFADLFNNNQIIIGKAYADQYHIKTGDLLELLYIPQGTEASKKINLDTISVQVSGIFKTGIDEFDGHVIFCSRHFFTQLFDAGIYQIGIKLHSIHDERLIIEKLTQRLGLSVFSWQDLYPAILSALTLEKYAMIFILTLITLIASMNIIALLFMYLTHKKNDIVLFKAMGMCDTVILKIFISLGIIITFVASLVGIIGAAVISWLLEKYHLISLPDAYYVSYLPAHLTGTIIIFVLILVVVMSFGATWFATYRVRFYSVTDVLKEQ
jgi:lipoprotein-releasing system permease protein